VERTVASLAVSAFVASCSLVLFMSSEVLGEPRPARAQTTGICLNAQLVDTFEGTATSKQIPSTRRRIPFASCIT
jgi:hypothetical protein